MKFKCKLMRFFDDMAMCDWVSHLKDIEKLLLNIIEKPSNLSYFVLQ